MNEDKRNRSGRYTDFPAAPPESNVNPPGRPQSSHGSATEPIPGVDPGNRQSGGNGARTPDDAATTAGRGTSRRDG